MWSTGEAVTRALAEREGAEATSGPKVPVFLTRTPWWRAHVRLRIACLTPL